MKKRFMSITTIYPTKIDVFTTPFSSFTRSRSSDDYNERIIGEMYFVPESIETTRRSHKMDTCKKISKRSALEFLPESLQETSTTRSVRQQTQKPKFTPELIETTTCSFRPSLSHEKLQFLPLPAPTTSPNAPTTANTPLTSSNLSAMLASLPGNRYNNGSGGSNPSSRVSPQTLSDVQGGESSACPSLSTSLDSTTSTLSLANAPDAFVNPYKQRHSFDENENGKGHVEAADEGTLVRVESASRLFPIEESYARVSADTNNNSNTASTPETHIASEDGSSSRSNKNKPSLFKPKSIHIPTPQQQQQQHLFESPLPTTLNHNHKSPDYLSAAKPCLWSSNASRSSSPRPAACALFSSSASSDNMSSSSSVSSASSDGTALTVPPPNSPSSSVDDKLSRYEISTTKVTKSSLWRPAPCTAPKPCLWSKPATAPAPPPTPPPEEISAPSLFTLPPTCTEPESTTEEHDPTIYCPTKPSEVSTQFVQQVFQYCSFNHECMAKDYDLELAEVTGLSVAEVRKDRFHALRKYVEDYIAKVPGIRTGQGW